MEDVFRALADPSRRSLLEELRVEEGQTLTRLCEGRGMTRQAVTKHLAVLEAAGVIRTEWEGREKRHWLNAARLQAVARWLEPFGSGVQPARRSEVGLGSKAETGADAGSGEDSRSISLCNLD